MGFLNSSFLISYFFLNCEESLSGTVCLRMQFMIKLPVFKWKNVLNIAILFAEVVLLYLKQTLTCLPMLHFVQILSNMKNFFLNIWSIQIFFTCGIDPIWAAWALFNFYLKQKQQIFWLICLKIALYSLFGQPELCLIFILSKNNKF